MHSYGAKNGLLAVYYLPMETLVRIIRVPHVPAEARVFQRRAARAIVVEEGRLLMVYSDVNGDYKFPGGGINEGESPEDALARELREECGRELGRVQGAFGQAYELDWWTGSDADVLEMVSYYYRCTLASIDKSTLNLDDYERELGFRPAWVEVEEALRANRAVLARGNAPRWTERDTRVLELLGEDTRR